MHSGWVSSFIEKRSSINRRLYKFNFTISEADYNVHAPPAGGAPAAKPKPAAAQQAPKANVQT